MVTGTALLKLNQCGLLLLLFAEHSSDRVHHVLTVLSARNLGAEPAAQLTAEHSFDVGNELGIRCRALNKKWNAPAFSAAHAGELRKRVDASTVEARCHLVVERVLRTDGSRACQRSDRWHHQIHVFRLNTARRAVHVRAEDLNRSVLPTLDPGQSRDSGHL